MNYFFKFLLPQVLDYFKDENLVKEFIPRVLLEYTNKPKRKDTKNEPTNK